MAGYMGYSMSNNAALAYECGEKPKSRWTKKELLENLDNCVKNGEIKVDFDLNILKKLKVEKLREILLVKTSWHHTSCHYNKTDFYSFDTEGILEFSENNLKNMIGEEKSRNNSENSEEVWLCSFLEWSGSRNYPICKRFEEIGVIKGQWFFRNSGGKKKISSNGFEFIKKIEA